MDRFGQGSLLIGDVSCLVSDALYGHSAFLTFLTPRGGSRGNPMGTPAHAHPDVYRLRNSKEAFCSCRLANEEISPLTQFEHFSRKEISFVLLPAFSSTFNAKRFRGMIVRLGGSRRKRV